MAVAVAVVAVVVVVWLSGCVVVCWSVGVLEWLCGCVMAGWGGLAEWGAADHHDHHHAHGERAHRQQRELCARAQREDDIEDEPGIRMVTAWGAHGHNWKHMVTAPSTG